MNKTDSNRLTTLQRMMINNESLPDDAIQLEQLLSEEGYDISNPQFQRQVDARNRLIDQRLTENRRRTRQRNNNYEQIRNQFLSWRDYSAIMFNFLFVVVGIPVGILLLVASEVVSVSLGLQTFFTEPAAVWLLSITLVLMYFAVEWRHAQLVAKYGKPAAYRFSLSTAVKRLKYLFSLDSNMQLEMVDDAAEIRSVNNTRNTLILIIVILGILGRLNNLLAAENAGAWYDQIVAIFKESSLKEFLEYMGGGFIALALLVATHYLVSYVYEIYRSAVGGADEVTFFDPAWEDRERNRLMVPLYQNQLRKIWVEKEADIRLMMGQPLINQLPSGNGNPTFNSDQTTIYQESSADQS